jgi:hypothetical protein
LNKGFIRYKLWTTDSGDRGTLQASGFVTPLTSPHNLLARERLGVHPLLGVDRKAESPS